jgi:hypothetical protein
MYNLDPNTTGNATGGSMENVPFTLNDVVINAELRRRPARPPDYKAERDALIVLLHAMADAPQ